MYSNCKQLKREKRAKLFVLFVSAASLSCLAIGGAGTTKIWDEKEGGIPVLQGNVFGVPLSGNIATRPNVSKWISRTEAGDDCEGVDIKDAPRYPGSQRVLYVREESNGKSITLCYRTSTGESSVLNFYRSVMRDFSWEESEYFTKVSTKTGLRALLFRKNGALCLICVEPDENGEILIVIVYRGCSI